MKILITGSTGQLGWELRHTLPALGEVVAVDRGSMDLSRTDKIRQVLREVRPDVVVNAAAYTAVDKAETDPELARLVNALAPGVIAEELRSTGGVLVHYSTDYVFDGKQQAPYTEEAEPAPLNVYGASKLEGERAIQAAGAPHLIFRTSWVYGMRGKNFLVTMLKLLQERDELKVVDDQIGAPTWSRWLARSTAQVVEQYLAGWGNGAQLAAHRSGIYHMTAAGQTSWFGFASAIRDLYLSEAQVKRLSLLPIPSAAYPVPAKRPANSVLSNAKLGAAFGVVQPPWESLLRQCMGESEAGTNGSPT